MATLKICDWFKTRINNDEETFLVIVDDKEFEVGKEGMVALLKQLEGNLSPHAPQVSVVEKIVTREVAPPTLQASPPGGIQIQTTDDPFDQGPSSMPVLAKEDDDGPLELEMPDDLNRKLKIPPRKLAERIIQEATVFDEGSLPSLTMGGPAHRAAIKRMKELEDRENDRLRRRAPQGVQLDTENERRPK